VIEKEAVPDDIYPPESHGSIKDLWVESFVIIHPSEILRGRILLGVLSQFSEIVSRVCSPNQTRHVYATAKTMEGQKLLSHMHFSEVFTEHPRKDGLRLFSVLYADLTEVLSKVLTKPRSDTLKHIAKNALKGGL
jgi:hypothetical protein